jgi:hypothetical protein
MSNSYLRKIFVAKESIYYLYNPSAPWSSLLISMFYFFGMIVAIHVFVLNLAGDPMTDLIILRRPIQWTLYFFGLGALCWFLERFRCIHQRAAKSDQSVMPPLVEKAILAQQGKTK